MTAPHHRVTRATLPCEKLRGCPAAERRLGSGTSHLVLPKKGLRDSFRATWESWLALRVLLADSRIARVTTTKIIDTFFCWNDTKEGETVFFITSRPNLIPISDNLSKLAYPKTFLGFSSIVSENAMSSLALDVTS